MKNSLTNNEITITKLQLLSLRFLFLLLLFPKSSSLSDITGSWHSVDSGVSATYWAGVSNARSGRGQIQKHASENRVTHGGY